MHSHKDTRTPDELARLGYEREDIGLRTIAIWVFWFFFFAAASGIATAILYPWIAKTDFFNPPKVEARSKYPAEPRLQDDVTVKTDIYEMRQKERDQLTHSGPSKQAPGAFQIPIDHAIDLWARRNGDKAPNEMAAPARAATESSH